MNNTDKFWIGDSVSCELACVSSNVKLSRLISSRDDDIPTL